MIDVYLYYGGRGKVLVFRDWTAFVLVDEADGSFYANWYIKLVHMLIETTLLGLVAAGPSRGGRFVAWGVPRAVGRRCAGVSSSGAAPPLGRPGCAVWSVTRVVMCDLNSLLRYIFSAVYGCTFV